MHCLFSPHSLDSANVLAFFLYKIHDTAYQLYPSIGSESIAPVSIRCYCSSCFFCDQAARTQQDGASERVTGRGQVQRRIAHRTAPDKISPGTSMKAS
ncbi:hypothetical protein IF1G_04139 [Cordyceps javanica]|uniref:Uncharacterized protein n=1 Tax=Cordyceps javanica TaxID=43265 RepID=A0A545V5A4_9HYPO|nr:hypothetical protein IF1G_04139 [Cordyceps javanica]